MQLVTLATTSSIVLLGDTLFDNYIITFDKIQGKIGFYGNTEVVHIFGSNSQFMSSQWGMMSIDIVFFVFALFLMCWMRLIPVNDLRQQLKSAGYGDGTYKGYPQYGNQNIIMGKPV